MSRRSSTDKREGRKKLRLSHLVIISFLKMNFTNTFSYIFVGFFNIENYWRKINLQISQSLYYLIHFYLFQFSFFASVQRNRFSDQLLLLLQLLRLSFYLELQFLVLLCTVNQEPGYTLKKFGGNPNIWGNLPV